MQNMTTVRRLLVMALLPLAACQRAEDSRQTPLPSPAAAPASVYDTSLQASAPASAAVDAMAPQAPASAASQ